VTTEAPEDRPAIVPKEKGDPNATEEKELPSDVPFPRRALGICVSNYLYANPVGYGVAGQSGQNLHSLMLKLSRVLRIPLDQVTELSDATFVPAARPTATSQPKGKRKAQP